MAIWPFVISKLPKKELVGSLINHEKIHLQQQLECLILGFYILYGIEFLFYRFKLKSSREAYLSISFEVEAYRHEGDPGYLKRRRLFANFKNKE